MPLNMRNDEIGCMAINFNKFDRLTIRDRASIELEFVGESQHPSTHSLAGRIEELQHELTDAEHSTRTLLAMNRLALEEISEPPQ